MRELFEKFGQRKVQDIRTALRENNINATGRLSASVQSTVTDNRNFIRLTVTALAYIATVDIGRQPTKNRGGGEFTVDKIKEWLVAKRVAIPVKYTLDSYAYVVWRKINREGTVQYRSKPRTIIKDAIELGIPEFEEQVAELGIETVLTELAKWQRL